MKRNSLWVNKWNSLTIAVLFLLSAFLSIALNSGSTSENEWSMLGRDNNRTSWDGANFPTASNLVLAKFTTGSAVNSIPIIVNGFVYVGSNDGYFYQLNASNISQEINRFNTSGPIFTTPYISISSAIAEDFVYFANADYLYQLNASNISQLILTFALNNNDATAPIVWDGYLYFGVNAVLYQLNASNISIMISNYSDGGNKYEPPTVAGPYLYLADDNTFAQLNASNLTQGSISSFSVGESTFSSPVVYNDFLYVGSDTGTLYQFNVSNLTQLISNYTTSNQIQSSPVVANGYIYIGSSDNSIYQLNASNLSHLIASYATGDQIFDTSVIANGFVYLSSNDGFIYMFNSTNITSPLTRYYIGNDSTSLSYANGYLYFGNNDSSVYQITSELNRAVLAVISPSVLTINVSQNGTFNVTINVSCIGLDCGDLNISLYPFINISSNATPFWAQDGFNSRNITLLSQQNTLVTFVVNVSGLANSTYEFYAIVNVTSDPIIASKSSSWFVSIVESPVLETCSDGILNQDETAADCGGSCSACVSVSRSSGGGGGGYSIAKQIPKTVEIISDNSQEQKSETTESGKDVKTESSSIETKTDLSIESAQNLEDVAAVEEYAQEENIVVDSNELLYAQKSVKKDLFLAIAILTFIVLSYLVFRVKKNQ